ncbi:MAG: hypothetical protein M3548_00090 [Actinomycetota bacterium]|nr:hypothetical protein [Actinomycetota bacterium]
MLHRTVLAFVAALAATLFAVPAEATSVAVPAEVSLMADTRPSGCSWRFKDPNPRERRINRNTYMHEMSNPPTCAPHGPILGTLSANSTFRVYYADPYSPSWCYGYSVQIARTGYILCEAYD